MTGTILTINAGSSSVKFSLFGNKKTLPLLAHGEVTDIGNKPKFSASTEGTRDKITNTLTYEASHEDALRKIIGWIHNHDKNWRIIAVAHRIVHGGKEFATPVKITGAIFQKLLKLCPLAPLHQRHNLAALGIVDRLLPNVPQIACFDTGFHADLDPLHQVYALPQELTDKGIRRYGFHGLSYEWIAHVLKKEHPKLAKGRVIAAHLGNGSSLCAMKNCRSVDTTMGMTALEGLPMGTRSGSIDPAAVIYMIRDLGMSADKTEKILYEKSGLKGLSGLTNDVKTLLASRKPKAKFALNYYALKVAQHIAMMAVSIGGIDAIVFTAGIGEHATSVRKAVLRRLAFLGRTNVLVIPANEERIMAMHVVRKLKI